MTSKTSLFNKGIYKSTVRRFLWGSVLYFIILFISTGMMILLNEDPSQIAAYNSVRSHSTILSVDYMIIPMLLSMVVPTVVGLLVFRFVHSRKASVFVHSLPVKREANYVSSVLAALTLMATPVVLNTVVLIIMSLTAYSLHFTVGECILWMLLNLFALFIMFSAVCFVSVITGNSFAMVGLNILFHTIALILAAAFAMVCEIFLYGFAGEGELIDRVFNNSFITRIPTIMTNWAYVGKQVRGYTEDIVIFSVIAILLYVVSGILYKKRRLETAEDVAGFKCLNGIFKYLVTFVGAISTFAVAAYSIYNNPIPLWVTVFVLSAVLYFGVEMILKKTLRVWKSYKGYIGFVAVFAMMMCVFAFTSLLGFETYIPEKEDIASATVYDYYRDLKPFFSDSEIVEKAIITHKSLLKEKEILSKREYDTRVHIEYLLKNGKEIRRVYPIDEDTLHDIMSGLYKSEEYKEKQERVLNSVKTAHSVELSNDGHSTSIKDEEKMNELVGCIKKDVRELSYNEIYSGSRSFGVGIGFLLPEEEYDIYEAETMHTAGDEEIRISHYHQSINSNYKHTIKWLRDNGLWEDVSLKNTGIMYVAKDWKNLPFFDSSGNLIMDVDIGEKELGECIKIEDADEVDKIVDFCNNTPREYVRTEDRYTVFLVNDEIEKDFVNLTSISMEELRKLFPEKNLDKLN